MLVVSVNLLFFPAELHLYEGFIGRGDQRSLWKASLQLVGLNKTKAEEMSDDWQLSVKLLLSRIFQKWSPSEKVSTEKLCEELNHFNSSLSSAATTVMFPDQSHLPTIMVGGKKVGFKAFFSVPEFQIHTRSLYLQASELITETLIRLLRREPKEEVPVDVRKARPLVVALSVFQITRKLLIDLGVKGWAQLCFLLSTETPMDNKSQEELSVLFPQTQQ